MKRILWVLAALVLLGAATLWVLIADEGYPPAEEGYWGGYEYNVERSAAIGNVSALVTRNGQSISIEPLVPFEIGSGRLIMGNQVDEHTFTPTLDGNYTLSMSKNPSFATLRLRVLDENETIIGSTWGNHVNLTLIGGQTYTIRIDNHNFPRPNPIAGDGWAYELTILEQKPTIDVSGYTIISDSLQFHSQVNNYTFTPLIDGNYQLLMSRDPSFATLRLSVLDENGTSIGSTWFNSLSVDLIGGQTYTIRVDNYNFHMAGPITGGGWAYTITIEEPPPILTLVTWHNNPQNILISPVTEEKEPGSPLGTLPTPAREGHVFVGWFDTQDPWGGNWITENTLVPDYDVTFWARWNDPSRHMRYWYRSNEITFRFCEEGDATNRPDMRRGMRYWNESDAPIIFREYGGSRNIVYVYEFGSDFLSRVILGLGYFGTYRPYIVYPWAGPAVGKFEIRMNTRPLNNPWWTSASREEAYTSIFAHELGHAIGLADNPLGRFSRESLMAQGQATVIGPTAFDVESVRMLYSGFAPTNRQLYSPIAPAQHEMANLSPVMSLLEGLDDNVEVRIVLSNYPWHDDMECLSSHATDIVRVEVLDERVELINSWLSAPPAGVDPYDIYTVYRLRVIESFYGGAASGDIIEVRQIGGRQGDELVINYDAAPIAVGDDIVLFIQESQIEGFPHILLNPQQTIFHATDDDKWEGSHQDNDFSFTIEELEEIIENAAQPTRPIPGNVTGSGTLSAADVGTLRAYLAGFPVEIIREAADVNGDGAITAADLGLIRAYLAGHPVVLLPPPS